MMLSMVSSNLPFVDPLAGCDVLESFCVARMGAACAVLRRIDMKKTMFRCRSLGRVFIKPPEFSTEKVRLEVCNCKASGVGRERRLQHHRAWVVVGFCVT